MRRMEQMLHRCHPRDLIKKVEQKCDCPFVQYAYRLHHLTPECYMLIYFHIITQHTDFLFPCLLHAHVSKMQ